MSKKNIMTITLDEALKKKGKTRKDGPPVPPLPADLWKNPKVVYPETSKEQITVQLDADILEWFKSQGRSYQTRMNAVLRVYVDAHREEPAPK
jgi:uncharacterized protein (DUF4415 family)